MQPRQRRTLRDFIPRILNFSSYPRRTKKVVGFVRGSESDPPAEVLAKWKSGKVASIETLALDEAHRRQGIASSLLTALFEAFKQKEIDLVTLSVPVVEVEAMKLYGKLGFEPRAQFLWKRLAA